MGSFLGTFADLTYCKLGNFEVESLAGRDAAGHPRWRVVCGKCGDLQIVPHSKIAPLINTKAAANFQCKNGACPLSRNHHHSETLTDLRQAERREAEEAARRLAEEQRAAAEIAAEDARLAKLKAQYAFYYRHQLKTKIETAQIVPFERWRQLTPETRKMVIETLRGEPTVFFTVL